MARVCAKGRGTGQRLSKGVDRRGYPASPGFIVLVIKDKRGEQEEENRSENNGGNNGL